MSKLRMVTTSLVVAALMLVAVSSVASAKRPDHIDWIRGFDNVWIDRAGANAFTATPGDRDLIIALAGDDVVDAGDRSDFIHGGRGDDSIVAGLGQDRVHSGPGNDTVVAGDGWDRVSGGRGADQIDGGPGLDRLSGDSGPDSIVGGLGPDIIHGGPGDDTIDSVDGGRDLVRCGPGNDSVTADQQDRVARSCETVVRVTPA